MCCIEMQYLQHVRIGEPVVPVKIYVRCFVTKIKSKFDDTYMVTVSDKWLANSEKYCSKLYLVKNLPNLYDMPLLWAQSNRAKIVLSSDWRISWPYCIDRLEKAGIKQGLVIGKTPEHMWIEHRGKDFSDYTSRGTEQYFPEGMMDLPTNLLLELAT